MQGYTFVTARFTNNERTTAEAIVEDSDKNLISIYVEAKDGDSLWEELLTNISIDQLHENTYKYIREQNDLFEHQVIEIAKKRGLVYDISTDSTAAFKVAAEIIFKQFDEKELKEYLFVYKLNLFENEVIKNSKDRTGKAAIRKATTIVEATIAACELYQSELAKK